MLSHREKELLGPSAEKYGEILEPTYELKYEEIKDKMGQKEKKGCRSVERKIKKYCIESTKFTCVNMGDTLRKRQLVIAELNGGMPGMFLCKLIVTFIKT